MLGEKEAIHFRKREEEEAVGRGGNKKKHHRIYKEKKDFWGCFVILPMESHSLVVLGDPLFSHYLLPFEQLF